MDLAGWIESSVSAMGRAQTARIEPLYGDASPRRYVRVHLADGTSCIGMDASDERESIAPFERIDALLRGADIEAPEILARGGAEGFLLLADLGDRLLLDLPPDSPECARSYEAALETLVAMQQRVDPAGLPDFDEAEIRRELGLFPEWFLSRFLQEDLPDALLEDAFEGIVDALLEQPRVFMHRDYHAANLMLLPDQRIGVIDFQDAVAGPVSYDLVSLLRDVYRSWDAAQRGAWSARYLRLARTAGVLDASVSPEQWALWCDWVGAQRCLKILGIFSRLHYRDGKPKYLASLGQTLSHLLDCCRAVGPLRPLGRRLAEYPERVQLRTRELMQQTALSAG